jgi:hypothetical protein
MGLLSNIIGSVYVVRQAQAFYKVVKEITKATDPESSIIDGLQIIKEECVPPIFKLSV